MNDVIDAQCRHLVKAA